jgi:hypothetical protein
MQQIIVLRGKDRIDRRIHDISEAQPVRVVAAQSLATRLLDPCDRSPLKREGRGEFNAYEAQREAVEDGCEDEEEEDNPGGCCLEKLLPCYQPYKRR